MRIYFKQTIVLVDRNGACRGQINVKKHEHGGTHTNTYTHRDGKKRRDQNIALVRCNVSRKVQQEL